MVQDTDEQRDGFFFLGNQLWLDLLNTEPRIDNVLIDLLKHPFSEQRWATAARLQGAVMNSSARSDLLALREALRLGFEDLRLGSEPPAVLLAQLNEALSKLSICLQIEMTPDGPRLDARLTGEPASYVARDFAEFICDYAPERLKNCDNRDCTMLFYDTGKNSRRRWCSMSACGNRDKVSRYRARHKA